MTIARVFSTIRAHPPGKLRGKMGCAFASGSGMLGVNDCCDPLLAIAQGSLFLLRPCCALRVKGGNHHACNHRGRGASSGSTQSCCTSPSEALARESASGSDSARLSVRQSASAASHDNRRGARIRAGGRARAENVARRELAPAPWARHVLCVASGACRIDGDEWE